MKDMCAENEWLEYDGDREKEFYDIRLKCGREIMNCYPNSDHFHDTQWAKKYHDSQVTHIRLSK